MRCDADRCCGAALFRGAPPRRHLQASPFAPATARPALGAAVDLRIVNSGAVVFLNRGRHLKIERMIAEPTKERCSGCGGEFAPLTGPVHRYMLSSPACWAGFGAIMAAEYADQTLTPVHRLSVDAFAVQHPGNGSRQAIQSVGLHLARLYMQIEGGLDPAAANAFMLRAGKRKAELQYLGPPAKFQLTVSDVAPFAGTLDHPLKVRAWAQSAWAAWAPQHQTVRRWAATV